MVFDRYLTTEYPEDVTIFQSVDSERLNYVGTRPYKDWTIMVRLERKENGWWTNDPKLLKLVNSPIIMQDWVIDDFFPEYMRDDANFQEVK